jgi:hypothetical protein
LEGFGFAIKIELTLNEKGSEFSCVGAIEDIRFSDFGSVAGALIFAYSLSELMNSVGKVWFIGI